MKALKNPVDISHEYARRLIIDGDIVVDATAGNGNDTLFLAELVGENGHVFSFDVQEKAIDATRNRLEQAEKLNRVTLIRDDHQNIDKHFSNAKYNEAIKISLASGEYKSDECISGEAHKLIAHKSIAHKSIAHKSIAHKPIARKPIKLVMFNLGYLPGGDHSIHTRATTTIEAIDKSLDLIVPGGMVIIVIYYGGDSGFEEKDAVIEYLRRLDYRKYSVLMHDYINRINCPPIVVCIEKV